MDTLNQHEREAWPQDAAALHVLQNKATEQNRPDKKTCLPGG
jgi:hypothetical protein